eukprot:2797866-Rhodomonas_salina.2
MAYAVLRFAWRCPGLTHSMASVKSAEKQLMQAESRASFDSTESRNESGSSKQQRSHISLIMNRQMVEPPLENSVTCWCFAMPGTDAVWSSRVLCCAVSASGRAEN